MYANDGKMPHENYKRIKISKEKDVGNFSDAVWESSTHAESEISQIEISSWNSIYENEFFARL